VFVILALTFVSNLSVAQNQLFSGDTLRMDEVAKYVVTHNDRAAAMRLMEKAARAKIGPAGAWDDPMLMVGVTGLPT
ncbi:MAG TPA: hypothetical protein DEO84_00390, partial [candidate division Zixibacteria bacterium]|nr:hypothetical protein [candidate division Zixibacteria bacterium]